MKNGSEKGANFTNREEKNIQKLGKKMVYFRGGDFRRRRGVKDGIFEDLTKSPNGGVEVRMEGGV